MSTYTAPMKDMQFVLHELAGLDAIARLPGYGDVSTELVDAVLEGAATFSGEVWGPLNKVGDQQGLKRHDDGRVTTPKGFVEAYAKFVESGWNGLRFDPAFGGQGLPKLVDTRARSRRSSCAAATRRSSATCTRWSRVSGPAR